MGYRNYAPVVGHIVDQNGHGDFLTIASAISAASSGSTIYLNPGIYTENLTLKAGTNLVATIADAFTPTVTIVGKCTYSSAGTTGLSGIRFKTNGDYCLEVSGSLASTLQITECFIHCANHTGINYSSSSSSSLISMTTCEAQLDTTGIAVWTMSSPGNLSIVTFSTDNAGSTITPSNNSAGIVNLFYNSLDIPVSTSGAGGMGILYSNLGTAVENVVTFTANGTGSTFAKSTAFSSGTAASVSIGAGATLIGVGLDIGSSNVHTITGAGTLQYAFISFSGTSSGHNVTTETALAVI